MKKSQLPVDKIITQLGYSASENLYTYKEFQSSVLSFYTKKILNEIKPYAAYIIDNKPFILFFDHIVNDEMSFKNISKKVWNAQIPVAIFCDTNTVKIFNGLELDISEHILSELRECSMEECDNNSDFSYWQISNPLFWNKYILKYSGKKLNQSLLENISYLTTELKFNYNIPFATKLILRLIFIRFLIDRGVDLDYDGFSANVMQSQEEFLKVVGSKISVYDLFVHLQGKFNGNLFELESKQEYAALSDQVFSLLSDFFSGKVNLGNRQLYLFKLYDFNIIPVELISNIYEVMIGKEGRSKDNTFYTPNYLVEYILDEIVTKTLKEKSSFTILDPSCGSGVFLVDSYRRIVQENLGENIYCENDELLKKLLTDNIYGIDVNEEAIDITIFSLYLTILDYKDPKTLSGFTLPNLKGENLFVSDFFDDKKLTCLQKRNVAFDFIIGNPPWGNTKEGLHISYCNERGYSDKQQNNEICRSFVFRAKDFCGDCTICCFILHSKLLYNKEAPAVNFRKFLLRETQIQSIIELSSVRKLVFENADAPAAIVAFKYNNQDNLSHQFIYTSVKPNIIFKLFHVICIEKNDVKFVPQVLLHNCDWAWKTIVYGFSHDVEKIIELKKRFPTVKSVLKSTIPLINYGGGIQSHLGDGKDATNLIGIPLLDSKNCFDHFFIYVDHNKKFNKSKIHRISNKELFNPPHCFIAKGINCQNYKMRAAYSDEQVIGKDTMYIIKGSKEQSSILLNLVGLFNSSFYAYFNLMIGSSVGIEREQRFMDEVLSFPYIFLEAIVKQTQTIQNNRLVSKDFDISDNVKRLDSTILEAFGLQKDKFIDYALTVTIPELTCANDNYYLYRNVSAEELEVYSGCFVEQFSEIYNEYEKYIIVTLYPDIGNGFSAFELQISERESFNKVKVATEPDEIKKLLSKFSIYKYNDKFFQIRDVIQFETDSFLIIKPSFYKNWHPAIAEMDLADVIDQIITPLGGEEQ